MTIFAHRNSKFGVAMSTSTIELRHDSPRSPLFSSPVRTLFPKLQEEPQRRPSVEGVRNDPFFCPPPSEPATPPSPPPTPTRPPPSSPAPQPARRGRPSAEEEARSLAKQVAGLRKAYGDFEEKLEGKTETSRALEEQLVTEEG